MWGREVKCQILILESSPQEKYCTEPQENMYEDIYDSFMISGSSLSISKGILCNISDELDISVAT